MEIHERIEENIVPLVVSALAAVFAALGAWVLTIFIGAKLIRGEWSYGFPLAFGVPVALVAGGVAFLLVFRKLRRMLI